jgi:ubiquinone/menaquinone biosynthesis C-methylase UbiE
MRKRDRQTGNGAGRPAPVSSELFTREYFTTDCEGYDLWREEGRGVPARIAETLDAAGDLAGKWLLDIGCGRGELVCEAAARGAVAVGLDYAKAALELAEERRDALQPQARERVRLVHSDAKELPFPDAGFDLVCLVDVYEHLHPYELDFTLSEARRLLRPGGRLLVHTGPNTWFYRFGYPPVRWLGRHLLRREFPEDLRGEYDHLMHVNEQSPRSLRLGLERAGFAARVQPRSFFTGIDPSAWERAAMRLLFSRPQGNIFCTSLLAVATPAEGGREPRLRIGRMARLLAPPRGSRVLLAGEGEGMLAARLSALPDTEVAWWEPESDGNTAGRLPYPDASFDRLGAQFTLEYVDNPMLAMREWARVLKEGGRLAVVVRNPLFRTADRWPRSRPTGFYYAKDLKRMARDAGLRVESVSTLVPDLRLPLFYRDDLTFSLRFERLPWFRTHGRLLFLTAVKPPRQGGGH